MKLILTLNLTRVQAQVHSSDASKNLPIAVSVLDHDHPDETTFRWNDAVALPIETEHDPLSKEESCRIVAVPKSTLGRFTVASFSSAFQKRYMPVVSSLSFYSSIHFS